MMVAYWILVAFVVIMMLAVDWFTFEVANAIGATESIDKPPVVKAYNYGWVVFFGFITGPFLALAQLVLMVGLFFNMAVPAKAEARGLLICAMVFGALVFVNAIMILLAQQQIIVSDEARAANMMKLLGGGAAVCFVVSFMSAMAYMSKLMIFMRMNMEASQPVTNTGFFLLFFVAMFVVYVANVYVCGYLHSLMGYIMIVAVCAAAALGARALIAQANLFLKVNKVITTYIKDA